MSTKLSTKYVLDVDDVVDHGLVIVNIRFPERAGNGKGTGREREGSGKGAGRAGEGRQTEGAACRTDHKKPAPASGYAVDLVAQAKANTVAPE